MLVDFKDVVVCFGICFVGFGRAVEAATAQIEMEFERNSSSRGLVLGVHVESRSNFGCHFQSRRRRFVTDKAVAPCHSLLGHCQD